MFQSWADVIAWRGEQGQTRLFLSSPEERYSLTYGEFYREAGGLARRLGEIGVLPGRRVALLLDNGPDWALALGAVWLAGCAAVPLNPKLSPEELAALLERSETSLVITNPKAEKEVGLTALFAWESLREVGAGARMELLLCLPGTEQEVNNIAVCQPEEAMLLFTSGSTGKPKGVVLTHENLLSEVAFIQDGHRLSSGDTVLCVLPFFHINGLVITLLTTLFSGGKAVIPHKFSASRFWQWAQDYRVTWFSAVPTILSILLSDRNAGGGTPYLRFARSASSSLPAAVLTAFEERFGVPVIEAYGLSEAASQVASNPLPPARRKIGSVGLSVGNSLQIISESGRTARVGAVGEVIVRGPNVADSYLHDPEASRESFRKGWFYTGDLGYFDEDGYLFLTGRRKELINRAGEKISPREVDEVLYRLPEIETAAAVGVPDELFGEEVVAFVQLRPEAQLGADRIIRHCQTCLAEFKTPKRILFVDDFPKGPNGKIQRRKLLELYQRITNAG